MKDESGEGFSIDLLLLMLDLNLSNGLVWGSVVGGLGEGSWES